MSNRVIRTFETPEHIAQAAAAEFVASSHDAVAARGRFTVALAGGSTPRRLYELLAEAPLRKQVNWAKVEIFWGDERPVPPDHADSNFGMARRALLDKLALPAKQIHRMPADRPDLDAAALDYEDEIAAVLGRPPDGHAPALDLVLLGMGPDGHTASLFPYSAALTETSRWVAANPVPKLKATRLTLTTPILNRAAQIIFLVGGADKAGVLAEVLQGPPDAQRLPAQLIAPVPPGQVSWLVDLAAARGLR
jgi:6-phosphogluconolactonase